MATEYKVTSPKSDFDGKRDIGGDGAVKYVGGKRQSVKDNHYKYGKLPRGEGSVGGGATQKKGKK